MESIFSTSTLIPVSLVLSIVSFTYFLGKQAQKLQNQENEIAELKARVVILEAGKVDVAILSEKMGAMEQVLSEIRNDLKSLIKK